MSGATKVRIGCKELATIHANVPVALLLVDEQFRVEKVKPTGGNKWLD